MLPYTNSLHLNASRHLIPEPINVLQNLLWHTFLQILPFPDWVWNHLSFDLYLMVLSKYSPVSGGQATYRHAFETLNRIIILVELPIFFQKRVFLLFENGHLLNLLRSVLFCVPFKEKLSLLVTMVLS